jgi:hypothetical protein
MAKSTKPWGNEAVAAVIGGIVVLLVDKALFANEFPSLLRVFVVATGAVFAWKAWQYYEILGGSDEPHSSGARDTYDSLRQELTEGGKPTKVYTKWLTLALGRVDKFFGDAGRNDRSWFASVLGLESLGPRWTAPAFDQCLLLALVYPLLTILIVWMWSGEVGVAEEALGLRPIAGAYAGLWRGMFGFGLAIQIYAFWRGGRAEGLTPTLLWLAGGSAVALAVAVAFLVSFAVSFAGFDSTVPFVGAFLVALAFYFAIVSPGTGAGVVALAVGFALPGALPGALPFTLVLVLALAGAIASGIAVLMISERSIKKGRQGVFLSLFVPTLLLGIFAGTYVLSTSEGWERTGVLWVVFGVLTLVNTPFDWVAIGLTRALLRRGLAPGGRGPYFYALIDAIVAVPLIMLLACVIIVAVQTFSDIAVLRAGAQARILPLGPLFEGLEDNPGAPKFWWIWLMLFSTLIPSLFYQVLMIMTGRPSLWSRWT